MDRAFCLLSAQRYVVLQLELPLLLLILYLKVQSVSSSQMDRVRLLMPLHYGPLSIPN
jgi:hypothetical protein